jgi:hypothetical protein
MFSSERMKNTVQNCATWLNTSNENKQFGYVQTTAPPPTYSASYYGSMQPPPPQPVPPPPSSNQKRPSNDSDIRSSSKREKTLSTSSRKGLPNIRDKHVTICSKTIWLGHLNKSTSEETLIKELLNIIGSSSSLTCSVSNFKSMSNDEKQKWFIVSVDLIPPRGCAFVEFNERRTAHKCLEKMKDGYKIDTNYVKVAWATNRGINNNNSNNSSSNNIKENRVKKYWNVELGCTYVPFEDLDNPKFDPSELAKWAEGGLIDEESLTSQYLEAFKQFKYENEKKNSNSNDMELDSDSEEQSKKNTSIHVPPPHTIQNMSVPPPPLPPTHLTNTLQNIQTSMLPPALAAQLANNNQANGGSLYFQTNQPPPHPIYSMHVPPPMPPPPQSQQNQIQFLSSNPMDAAAASGFQFTSTSSSSNLVPYMDLMGNPISLPPGTPLTLLRHTAHIPNLHLIAPQQQQLHQQRQLILNNGVPSQFQLNTHASNDLSADTDHRLDNQRPESVTSNGSFDGNQNGKDFYNNNTFKRPSGGSFTSGKESATRFNNSSFNNNGMNYHNGSSRRNYDEASNNNSYNKSRNFGNSNRYNNNNNYYDNNKKDLSGRSSGRDSYDRRNNGSNGGDYPKGYNNQNNQHTSALNDNLNENNQVSKE